MLVVDVNVRVLPGRMGGFLAAAARKLTAHYAAWRDAVAEIMAVPREPAKFAAVFPAGDEGREGGSR